MVKIAFCDDDIAVVRQIAALLNKYRETRDQPMECHAFESSLELLAAMEQGLRPDVLLLDVIMPGENGISAAREIREYDRNVKIIFLTSSAEYAVQSYTVDAYYYQLKPIREETFFQVLDSVLDECCRSAENSVMLRCKSGIVRVRLEKLMYCEVVGRTLLLHLDNGKTCDLKKDTTARSMLQMMDTAPKKGFDLTVTDPADVTGFLRYMLEAGRTERVAG